MYPDILAYMDHRKNKCGSMVLFVERNFQARTMGFLRITIDY